MNRDIEIISGHSISEYKHKYPNYEKCLYCIDESKVDSFDDKFSAYRSILKKNYLLKDYKWWLINGVYYEVPRFLSVKWFKSVRTGFKFLTLLSACGVAAGVSAGPFFVYKFIVEKNNKEKSIILNPKVSIDPDKSFAGNVDEYTKRLVTEGTIIDASIDANHNAVYKIYLNSNAKATLFHINSIFGVKRGNINFGVNDYTIVTDSIEDYNYSHTITIKDSSLRQYSGEISIVPEYKQYDYFPVPPTTENKLKFVLDSSSYKVQAVNTAIEGIVSIPTSYNSKPVKSIDNDGFKDCKKVTEVYFPNTITSIGNNAFQNLSLDFINFRNGTEDLIIGESAFSNNKNLYYISLPGNIKEIKQSAFSGCEGLTILNLSNVFNEGSTKKIPTLGSNAFFNCSSIKSIYVWNDEMKDAFVQAPGWSDFADKFISVI